MRDSIGVSVEWVVKERRGGLWVPVLRAKNLVTDYGLTQMASLWNGQYVAPQWLAVDTDKATVSIQVNPGGTSVQVNKRIDIAGDTQIWLSPGQPAAEKVTFSSVTTSAPYIYTLSTPAGNTHPVGDTVLRAAASGDGLSTLVSEGQYDAAGAPNQRMQTLPGFSPGDGQWTLQFYYTGTQALFDFNTLALMDSPNLGQGNMHNHFVLGYTHPSGTDVEIDGTLTMTNN